MLAGFEDGDGHFRMELVWRRQRDDIDLGVVNDGAPVTGTLGEAEFGGTALGKVLVDLAEMDQPWFGHVGKDSADRVPGDGVALAHEACADKTDSDHSLVSAIRKICVDELVHFIQKWNACLIFYGLLAQARYDGAHSID